MMDCAEWQPYFAWRPVYVDAYDASEIKDGHMSYRKWGWVERRLHIWADDEFGDGPVEHRVWRFRLARRIITVARTMMMKQIKQYAFAAAYTDERQPHIMAWTIAGSPFTVRERVGAQWCKEDPKNGWKAARIEGIKVVKVTLTAAIQ